MSSSQPPEEELKVAVSYSWTEEREEGVNQSQVSRFQQALLEKGVVVIRDKDRVQHGQRLDKFMDEEIGGSNQLCVFLSEGYLKSPHCMRELVRAWKLSKRQPEDFGKRVKAWIMPGLSLKESAQRVSWTKYWTAEYQKAKAAVKNTPTKRVKDEHARIRRMEEFVDHVNEILNFIERTLLPKDAKDFLEWVANEFKLEGLSKEYLLGARGRIIKSIESKITNSNGLKAVFHDFKDLGKEVGGRFQVDDELKSKSDRIKPIMKQLLSRVHSTVIAPADKEAMRDIVGGIVALGVRPSWIVEQVQKLEGERVVFSAEFSQTGAQPVQAMPDQTKINLLHVLGSALAGSFLKPAEVFIRDPMDAHRRGPAKELKGIDKNARDFEMKEFFVSAVSPDTMPKKPKDNEATDEKMKEYRTTIENMFREVKQHLEFAYDAGGPWCCTDPAFKPHLDRVRRLGLFHILFLFPSKGQFNDVFDEFIYVLSAFREIDGLLGPRAA
ncbi:MAG: toll/interleukin-1 receptor domain-containing protein [Verrucomicrobiota bacterium]|jgi:hypothetical protein